MAQYFKVGDTVLIIEPTDEQKRHYGPNYVSGMDKYIGQTAIITKHNRWFRIDIDCGAYAWDSVSFKKEITNDQLIWI